MTQWARMASEDVVLCGTVLADTTAPHQRRIHQRSTSGYTGSEASITFRASMDPEIKRKSYKFIAILEHIRIITNLECQFHIEDIHFYYIDHLLEDI